MMISEAMIALIALSATDSPKLAPICSVLGLPVNPNSLSSALRDAVDAALAQLVRADLDHVGAQSEPLTVWTSASESPAPASTL